jgi:hypothetical protein
MNDVDWDKVIVKADEDKEDAMAGTCEGTVCKPAMDMITDLYTRIDAKISVKVFLAGAIIFSAMAGFMVTQTIAISKSAAVIESSVHYQGVQVQELKTTLGLHDLKIHDLEKSMYGKAE